MTPEEARTRLGLGPAGPLDRTELRRAYLQAIKRAKPEVDPQGFQEARQAYELLDGLLRMGMPLPVAPVVTVPEAPAPEAPPLEEEPAPDHLAPYRKKLDALFGMPWQQRAEVGWEAYQALPGDPDAREFLLELLPLDDARNDITALLLEGARAGDFSCLVRLIQVTPGAVPDELLEALESRGGPGERFQRFLVAQARVGRGQADRAMALLEQVLSNDGTQLPEPMLVEWTLGLSLQLAGQEDWVRYRQARDLLHRYLNSPSLPADAATPNASKLFALIGELDQASYLPPEVRAELARGFVAGRWDRLPGVLAAASRQLGPTSFERKLDRLRTEAPALSAVIHAHRIQSVAPSGGGSGWWRLVMVMAALSGSRMLFTDCGRSAAPPPRALLEQFQLGQPSYQLKLSDDLTAPKCGEHAGRNFCTLLPDLLNRGARGESCESLQEELRRVRVESGPLPPADVLQLDLISKGLRDWCKR